MRDDTSDDRAGSKGPVDERATESKDQPPLSFLMTLSAEALKPSQARRRTNLHVTAAPLHGLPHVQRTGFEAYIRPMKSERFAVL